MDYTPGVITDQQPADRDEVRAFALFRDLVIINQQQDRHRVLCQVELIDCAEKAAYAVRAFNKAWSTPAEE